MGLVQQLGEGPIAIDTVTFIYLIEESPEYFRLIEPLFSEIDRGRIKAFTSSLTLLEVLVVPYRASDLALVDRYEEILTRSRGIELIDIDREQIRAAALLRARYRLRTPDALQIATALSKECKVFVTNDRDLPDIAGLRMIQLRNYLG
jgi:predicted nucleic acid-binding protein